MAKLIKRNGKYYVRRFALPMGFEYLSRRGDYWWSRDHAETYSSFSTPDEAEQVWKNSRTEVIKKLK